MATKQAVFVDALAGEPSPRDVQLTIRGLRQVDTDRFILSCVPPERPIDWELVAQAIRMPSMPDALADRIYAVIARHDMIELLADRIGEA
jgi:hypothetical protein